MLKTMTEDEIDLLHEVEIAYRKAKGAWVGADWTHESGVEHCERHGGSACKDDDCKYERCEDCHEEVAYCTGGGPDCEVCGSAEEAAVEAEEEAALALRYARKGEWDRAADAARQAAEIEAQFGDDPVWGPMNKLLRNA